MHLQVQVRSKNSSVDDVRRRQTERLDNVFNDGRYRRGCWGQGRGMSKAGDHILEFDEGGPELVSPLRHAVRLVHHESIDRVLTEHLDEGSICRQPLRSREDEVGARTQSFQRLALFDLCQGAVELCRVDSQLLQFILLILHQRDERRYNDGCAIEVEAWELIT